MLAQDQSSNNSSIPSPTAISKKMQGTLLNMLQGLKWMSGSTLSLMAEKAAQGQNISSKDTGSSKSLLRLTPIKSFLLFLQCQKHFTFLSHLMRDCMSWISHRSQQQQSSEPWVWQCPGLTPAGNQAPHSCSLTPSCWNGGENQMGKSEKTCGLW